MNRQKTIAQFIRFLKQKKAWPIFKINIKGKSLQDGMAPRSYKTHGGVNVPFYLNECPPEFYVSSSFSWEHSPQGYDYWDVMDNEWQLEV